jgi:hypothetical protein
MPDLFNLLDAEDFAPRPACGLASVFLGFALGESEANQALGKADGFPTVFKP